MKVITITGPQGCGKSVLAERRYNEAMAQGLSVAMYDTGSYGDYFSDERASKNPDVKIITQLTPSGLMRVYTETK